MKNIDGKRILKKYKLGLWKDILHFQFMKNTVRINGEMREFTDRSNLFVLTKVEYKNEIKKFLEYIVISQAQSLITSSKKIKELSRIAQKSSEDIKEMHSRISEMESYIK